MSWDISRYAWADDFQLPAASGRQTPEFVRALWKSGRNSQSISSEHLSPDDVIIAYVSFTLLLNML